MPKAIRACLLRSLDKAFLRHGGNNDNFHLGEQAVQLCGGGNAVLRAMGADIHQHQIHRISAADSRRQIRLRKAAHQFIALAAMHHVFHIFSGDSLIVNHKYLYHFRTPSFSVPIGRVTVSKNCGCD